jgi:2-polyprenyl-3-methyl-5-hydroxy-6-metoxy-1,4-benzoquinol methylase
MAGAESDFASDSTGRLADIIQAYDSPIVRAYCWGRFQILRLRFLDEIGQYLPRQGSILDIGCGFGLFSLYFAHQHPDRQVHGFDLNPKRIDMARRAAEKLGLKNVSFHAEDATKWRGTETFDSAYMIDIVHHVPRASAESLLEEVRKKVKPTGVVIVKDVADKPFFKTAFTWALDKLMDPKTPVHYWSVKALTAKLRRVGFGVTSHLMVDYLPYPHVIYICRPI